MTAQRLLRLGPRSRYGRCAMTLLSLGSLKVRAFGGTDGRGGGDGPAIVLCHGFGAAGDDLCGLYQAIDVPASVRWFFPEAPLRVDFGFGMEGRAWWHIDMVKLQEAIFRGQARRLVEETPDGLHEARIALESCVEALSREFGVSRGNIIIGGFSQGAMLSTELALFSEQPFAGLVVMSGTLLSQDRWRAAAVRSAPSISAFVSHGRSDPLLPFVLSEALCAMLREHGANVVWVPHSGQHEIPMPVLAKLSAFVAERFAAHAR